MITLPPGRETLRTASAPTSNNTRTGRTDRSQFEYMAGFGGGQTVDRHSFRLNEGDAVTHLHGTTYHQQKTSAGQLVCSHPGPIVWIAPVSRAPTGCCIGTRTVGTGKPDRVGKTGNCTCFVVGSVSLMVSKPPAHSSLCAQSVNCIPTSVVWAGTVTSVLKQGPQTASCIPFT